MKRDNSEKNYKKTTLSKGDLISDIDNGIEENYGRGVIADFGEYESAKDSYEEKYIVFTLLNKKYAVPILYVVEIGDLTNITSVPNLPSWIRGVTNIRGEIVSVIDLGTYLGIPKMDILDSGQMLVIRSLEEDVNAAIIVDQVNQIYNVPEKDIMKPEAPVDNKLAPFLYGVCEFNDELLMLVNLEKFFSHPEIRQFQ